MIADYNITYVILNNDANGVGDTMIRSGSSVGAFPLLALLPVSDRHHAWSALLLALEGTADGDFLVALFGEYRLGQVLGPLTCIVRQDDPAAIDDDQAKVLPAAQIVLLFPLKRAINPASRTEFARLSSHGFRLMADGVPEDSQTLDIAIGALATHGILPRSSALARLPGPHLATGVDSPSRFVQFQRAGCAWFAGDYPLHPDHGVSQQELNSRTLLLKLLGMVASDTPTDEIEALLKQGTSLSYHLLKLVNSVNFALKTKITSFGYAITLLGRRQLRRWLQLLLYVQDKGGGTMSPLLARAALRGSLMEALCQKIGGSKDDQDHAFMVGIFSLLDVLFGMPLAQIVTPLRLADEVEEALLAHGGWLGGLLAIVEQQATLPGLAEGLAASMMTPSSYCQALVQACEWSIQVGRGT